MVTIGFVVEGGSDEFLPKSPKFRQWLESFKLQVVDPVIDAGGNGNMCNRNIGTYVDALFTQSNPDKIIVLADLDPDICAPCIEARKAIIGDHKHIDLVIIAKKAIEAWFLADTEAMRQWTGDEDFEEKEPENMQCMPWDRLKQIGQDRKRGPGSKKAFARKFIRDCNFDIRRAANHPNCPSARYFVEKLTELGRT